MLQEHFIRYEQLAAYLRHVAKDNEIMGIKRVRRRWAEAGKTLSIGTKPQDLILSDQVSYGIWGLYSTALRETGLVKGENRELTEKGLDIAQRIDANLFRNGEGQGRDWYWRYIRGDKTVKVEELEAEGKRFVNWFSLSVTIKSVNIEYL